MNCGTWWYASFHFCCGEWRKRAERFKCILTFLRSKSFPLFIYRINTLFISKSSYFPEEKMLEKQYNQYTFMYCVKTRHDHEQKVMRRGLTQKIWLYFGFVCFFHVTSYESLFCLYRISVLTAESAEYRKICFDSLRDSSLSQYSSQHNKKLSCLPCSQCAYNVCSAQCT